MFGYGGWPPSLGGVGYGSLRRSLARIRLENRIPAAWLLDPDGAIGPQFESPSEGDLTVGDDADRADQPVRLAGAAAEHRRVGDPQPVVERARDLDHQGVGPPGQPGAQVDDRVDQVDRVQLLAVERDPVRVEDLAEVQVGAVRGQSAPS